MIGNKRQNSKDSSVTDAVGSDPVALERDAGMVGKLLIRTLDNAMSWQTSAISAYVRSLRKKSPKDTPAQIQQRIDKHLLNIVTGTGGAAGGAAVIPGVGFVTGTLAVAGESLLFLEAAAWHALASAELRGIDISERERRRSLILVSLTGARGTALVATTMGDSSLAAIRRNNASTNAGTMINTLGVPQLGGMNKLLFKEAQKRLMKSGRAALLGKIMPMGIGVVVGSVANRKLGKMLIENTRTSLGPLPHNWTEFDAVADAHDKTDNVESARNSTISADAKK